jgi:hypothetical protein
MDWETSSSMTGLLRAALLSDGLDEEMKNQDNFREDSMDEDGDEDVHEDISKGIDGAGDDDDDDDEMEYLDEDNADKGNARAGRYDNARDDDEDSELGDDDGIEASSQAPRGVVAYNRGSSAGNVNTQSSMSSSTSLGGGMMAHSEYSHTHNTHGCYSAHIHTFISKHVSYKHESTLAGMDGPQSPVFLSLCLYLIHKPS